MQGLNTVSRARGLVHWVPQQPQTQQAMNQAQAVQPGAKGDGAKERAGDKATAWVQSPSMSQGQRQGWRQAVIYVRKTHPGDRLPTAEVLGPWEMGQRKGWIPARLKCSLDRN